ncbi:MAG: hypothetical protein ACI8RD_011528 [Bacillariaceae sp.]|jgi:hypothetical protein
MKRITYYSIYNVYFIFHNRVDPSERATGMVPTSLANSDVAFPLELKTVVIVSFGADLANLRQGLFLFPGRMVFEVRSVLFHIIAQ